ncbi:serine hydrolase [Algibacter aquimarinus]|uniref:Beta-lactamase n=1 Tax=Algibacter aquimarinus TaxID=1136748 RepID=A0ABP9HCW4_9FLAO
MNKITASVLMLLLFCSSISFSQKTTISLLSSEIKEENILKILETNTLSFPNNTQISIAIVNGDNTNYIGLIKENDTLKVINNKRNIFEIGSISKTFTSVLLSNFINQKELTLNETLENQFDFELKSGKNIQLVQLANHTSGLPRIPSNMMLLMSLNQNNPFKNYTPKLLETYLKDELFLLNPTGEKSSYSNLGAGLLGYILTKKSQTSYEGLLQKYIFKPLGMRSSASLLENVNKDLLVKGRDDKGNVVLSWEFTDAMVGAGGIKSSVFDMEKYLRKNLTDDPVYSLTHKTTFTISETSEIALGWHISKNKKTNIIWHNGATGGYRSCMTFNKSSKKGVIVLSNVSGLSTESYKIDSLCFQLIKTLTKPF